MSHSYIANLNNLCAICARSAFDHSELAQCEACPTVGPCEVLNGMLLCEVCYAHDIDLVKSDIPEANDRVTQLVNRLSKEIPSDRRQYFVGRITSIVDIEKELQDAGLSTEDTRHKLAQIVESNLVTLKERLSIKHAEIREMQGESIADQKYLNMIVPQLRAEEREKFKAYDITYKPSAVTNTSSTVSKPRMSASDKAVESMAKMLNINVEQARIIMSNSVKSVLSVKCTCSETPGICKVHNP